MIETTLQAAFGSASPAAQAGSNERSSLGQDEFLMLMVTQLRNQDPFQPLENGEFLGQMAQFSTVSGISEMSESLASLSQAMYANQVLQAASLVGHEVLASGNAVHLADGQPVVGAAELPFSGDAFVRVFDDAGQLMREIQLGTHGAGTVDFEWDGLTSDGAAAPPGRYWVAAGIRDGEREIGVETFVSRTVESVALNRLGGIPELTTSTGERLSLAEVKSIR